MLQSLLVLFFATAVLVGIIAALFYVDYAVNKKARREDEPTTFYSLGKRGNHPVWAWMVGIVIWTIMGLVAFGTIQYMLFGHHGPHLAHIFQKTEEESRLLKEVAYQEYAERKRHFHNLLPDSPLEEKQPVCYYCHGNMPHKREKFIRVMMNMHTQFIGCMTCHVRDIDEKEIVLKWYNYSQIKVVGRPFGLEYDPKTGSLGETDDIYSKIVAFVKMGGTEKMIEIPEYEPMAQDFIKIRDRLTTEEQGKVKNKFHANVAPKGRFCSRCHTEESASYIPYRSLGFSEARINDLTGLNIVGIVTKYKEFYIPTIFRGTEKPEEVGRVVGQEVAPRGIPSEIIADPRSWWRENYIPQERFPQKTWQK
jgi:hypothetical protein